MSPSSLASLVAVAIAVMLALLGLARAARRGAEDTPIGSTAYLVAKLAAGLFPFWIFPLGVGVSILTGRANGCMPKDLDLSGVIVLITLPSIGWAFLLPRVTGAALMAVAPLLGAFCAAGVYAGMLRHMGGVEQVMMLAMVTPVWVLPQMVYGAIVMRARGRPGLCPRCAHDRSALSSALPCPACGIVPRQE